MYEIIRYNSLIKGMMTCPCQVGEHIPAAAMDAFLGNLLRHARRGLVLSWAVPGQGGHFHINELPNQAVVRTRSTHLRLTS
jgi:hypothetical protein